MALEHTDNEHIARDPRPDAGHRRQRPMATPASTAAAVSVSAPAYRRAALRLRETPAGERHSSPERDSGMFTVRVDDAAVTTGSPNRSPRSSERS